MIRLRIFRKDGVCEVFELYKRDVRAIVVENECDVSVFPDDENTLKFLFGVNAPDENVEIVEALEDDLSDALEELN